MREIKFRAWDTELKEWIKEEDFAITQDGKILIDVAGREYTVSADKNRIKIVQFTGLLDKNGKEIYEGDIIEINHNPEEVDKGSVSYSGSCFQVDFQGESEILEYLRPVEIIGNIYQNKNLL